MYTKTAVLVVIIILLTTTANFNIIEFILLLLSAIILKFLIGFSTEKNITGGRQSAYSIVSGLENAIKKISNNYTHFKKYRELLLKNIDKKNNVMITLDDIKYTMPYTDKNQPIIRGNHIGQRKLLLSEVQFLTQVNSGIKYCIYAGSAPGHKTHFLSKLFPDTKFILIDPNKFNLVIVNDKTLSVNKTLFTSNKYHRDEPHNDIVHIYSEYHTNSNKFINKKLLDMNTSEKKSVIDLIINSKYKIFIIEDFMDDNYAEFLKQVGKTTFISDIRSNTSKDDGHPLDIDIYWNTSMMYNWMNILKPELSMLKIRMPFFNEKVDMSMYESEFKASKKYGIDFIDDYNNFKFNMSKSVLYLQAWSRQLSTELRMYIKKNDINNIVNYNTKEIENKMFYFNVIDRTLHMHKNINASKQYNFCYCNDCSLENEIWMQYLEKIKNKYINNVFNAIKITNEITNRSLYKTHKNTLWKPVNNLFDLNRLYIENSTFKQHIYIFKNQKGETGKRIDNSIKI